MASPLARLVEGEGKPLVMLNGGLMSYGSWDPVLEKMRRGRRIVRFDFRHQLFSLAAPDVRPGLAGHAADLAELLDELGVGPADFVATSFGAEVALELALGQPERFKSLTAITAMDRETPEFRAGNDEMQEILVDILAGGSRRPFWDALLRSVYSAGFQQKEAEFLESRGAKLDLLPAAYFKGVSHILRDLEGFDFSPRLARFPFPSLVVNAADDQVMPPERSRALAEAIGAEVLVHPESGHGLVAEDPAWVGEACGDFLARLA
jgi:pimeloyl-ACP methyl ester carboxylesterase